jgi:predicted RNA binding protein YcfA (HicA-like mRNA interferase family)
MKRIQFIKHLQSHGCRLKREGGEHSIFINPLTGKKTTVPRHSELGNLLCDEICKQLGVQKIK